MHGMYKAWSIFIIAQSAIVLSISFFVLVVLRKIETKALKVFGYIVSVSLLIAAFLLLAMGLYKIVGNICCPRDKQMMMHKMDDFKQHDKEAHALKGEVTVSEKVPAKMMQQEQAKCQHKAGN